MKGSKVTDTQPITWTDDNNEKASLAAVLIVAGTFDTPEKVLEFFERPWKWQPEFDLWTEFDKPICHDCPKWHEFAIALDRL